MVGGGAFGGAGCLCFADCLSLCFVELKNLEQKREIEKTKEKAPRYLLRLILFPLGKYRNAHCSFF